MRPSNPAANVYAADFGPAGFDGTIYYLIDESLREVHILEVLWVCHVDLDRALARARGDLAELRVLEGSLTAADRTRTGGPDR